MVGNCADSKCALAKICRIHIERSSLHLNTENAKLCPLHSSLCICVVEGVGGEEITNAVSCADLFSLLDSNLHHIVACNGSKRALKVVLYCIVGVGACSHAEDDVANLNLLAHSTCRTDTHNVLNTEVVKELVGVDTDRGHTHTGSHYRNSLALPKTCVAVNTAHVVNKLCILKEGLCNKLCSEGVTGHKHGLCEIIGCCLYMRCVKFCVIHFKILLK